MLLRPLMEVDDMADDSRNVAVLIDFENLNESQSLEAVVELGAKYGRVVVKSAIGNFSAIGDNGQQLLQQLGIQTVHQSTAGKGKNSSDMRMAIEAVNLFHDREKSIDVFVLATSDVDFLPLAQWLRASGKHVVGAGRSDASSKWQTGVDEFVVVKEVKVAEAAAKSSSAAKSRTNATSKSPPSTKTSKPATKGKTAKSNALNPKYNGVIETAINEVFSNGATEVKSRTLLKRIVKLDPQFSCKKAGFNSFRKLVASFNQVRIPAIPSTGEFVIHKSGANNRPG